MSKKDETDFAWETCIIGICCPIGIIIGIILFFGGLDYFMPFITKTSDSLKIFITGTDYEKGMRYYKKGKYTEAVEFLKKEAAENHPTAQYLLGECYYYGRGVKLDYSKAFEWYRNSAVNGLPSAFCALGRCYQKGHGVNKNLGEAFENYKKAADADNGIADAQCWLGNYYRGGRGPDKTPKYIKAFEYFKRAADQNHVEGLRGLAWCYKNGRGIGKDIAKADALHAKANALEEKAKKLLAENGEE